MRISKVAACALFAHVGLFWAGVIVTVFGWRMLFFLAMVAGLSYVAWWRFDAADRQRAPSS